MRVTEVTANLPVDSIEAACDFYKVFLGLSVEAFNLGWVMRLESPDGTVGIQLVTKDATAPVDSVMSLRTDDLDAAYDEAQRLGYEIVHPITREEWGVRRFFVRAPDGSVFNIVGHGK